MIHSISSNQSSFKAVKFIDGFNVVLAKRTQESTDKDSVNGLGKSTLIDILHFCLGGKKNKTLNKQELAGWTFTVKLDIGRRKYSVSRNITHSKKIFIEGDCKGWLITPVTSDQGQYFTAPYWTKALGYEMCGIAPDERDYAPTFRSLISYSARRGYNGGYHKPFMHYAQQKVWDQQVHGAYLLGLDWMLAAERQILKDRQNDLQAIQRSLSKGTLLGTVGTPGDLEAIRIRLDDEIKKDKELLRHFKVHKEYQHIEEEANHLTEKLHKLLDLNVTNKQILELYQLSLIEESDVEPKDIIRVYNEANVKFPEEVVVSLREVQQFHRNVVKNRRGFLNLEITRLKDTLAKRKIQIEEIDANKSKLMKILKTHGALNEFQHIQENHQKNISKLDEIENKLEMLKKVRHEKDLIQTESIELRQKMDLDWTEREKQRREAIMTFNSYSQSLYDAPGSLSIDTSAAGYKFTVTIERSGSHAYENMQIFCYDLMLTKLWTSRNLSPGFLIHDSDMFDGVDERQVAHALKLASAESNRHSYQYICMLNSDAVPYDDFGQDFNFTSRVAANFTDATTDGGLLGIRF